MLIDLVFSIDSVITAVGMTQNLAIMVIANIIALAVMLIASGSISRFVDDHPTIKILALSFLLMIGLVLVGEASGFHIPKGYVYFAMGFSVFVELINIRASKKAKPVKLHNKPH
jgi:predicted tellurium resistance membrane protein TerC